MMSKYAIRDAADAAAVLLGKGEKLSSAEWHGLLSLGAEASGLFAEKARNVSALHFGNGVYVRALIEISSFCRNGCRYCGLRNGNRLAVRYRLSKEQILACCERAALSGFNTFVLQGGEDPVQSDEWLADVIAEIKRRYPDKAVTLSVGERSAGGYALLRSAGADRYLLRHETANEEHYGFLHPENMSARNRRQSLLILRDLGYQVGAGMMIGSPGQSAEHLVEDLMLLDELQPQMIGIGPFIPAAGTPFADENPGSVETTLLLLSLLRLRFPLSLIPATTALASLSACGTERGILAGANVVMPNFTLPGVRGKYTIYDNKKCSGSESAEELALLEGKLNNIGYKIDYGRGDYMKI